MSGWPNENSATLPLVSVIIPARNAEASISSTLDSVMAQDYAGAIEVIVADGSDSPATAEVVRQQYPAVQIVPNPERTTPNGLNAAIEEASGQIVVRCDCHATLPPDYVQRGVETLMRTGAAVVGGRQRPVGDTLFERAVGLAISTPLGAGDARYRLGGAEGPVDNFYLGVYRRDALEAVGGFDPALSRGQDAELNWRLRRGGEVVWFDPAMTAFYRPARQSSSLGPAVFRLWSLEADDSEAQFDRTAGSPSRSPVDRIGFGWLCPVGIGRLFVCGDGVAASLRHCVDRRCCCRGHLPPGHRRGHPSSGFGDDALVLGGRFLLSRPTRSLIWRA